MAKIKFADTDEIVITSNEFPLAKAKEILRQETIAAVGYGIQGSMQALNLRDNGFKVIVGQRKESPRWQNALRDGWKEGETLFPIEDACRQGTTIINVLSETGQVKQWPAIKRYLTPGKTLSFACGFSTTFSKTTGILPARDIDVILVVTRGSGRTYRQRFIEKKGFASSFAVLQDVSGRAESKALALGIGIGSGQLFKTTFEKEAYSDLVGERGILVGALTGMIEAQYNELRRHGHSPSEAFNETVEELTESLIPLLGANGMDWLLENCSVTAQRGALDWKDKFKTALEPVFAQLYESVSSGREAERVISATGDAQYSNKLNKELKQIKGMEIWRTGAKIRSLRS
jgi:ketol-acid reductoisomerase